MKNLIYFVLGSFLAGNALSASVEVIFDNPDKFRDVEYGYHGQKRGQKIYLPQLEKHIIRQAERVLEDGQAFIITITDIDLAGEHEPWRTPPMDDIRIVKSIYPPRMDFSYEVRDSAGNVLKSGEERLTDLNFDFRIRINYHDDLFYDKAMITDWFRSLSKDLKQSAASKP